MSYVPSGDCEIFVMLPGQFNALMAEDRRDVCALPASMLSTKFPWNHQARSPALGTQLPTIHPDPSVSLNPLAKLDDFNENLEDKTYVDIFDWNDLAMVGRTAIK